MFHFFRTFAQPLPPEPAIVAKPPRSRKDFKMGKDRAQVKNRITWRQDASYNWQGVTAKGEHCAVTRIINEGFVTSWSSQYDGSINVGPFIEKSAEEAKALLEWLFDYSDEERDEPRGLSAGETPVE